MITVCFYRLLLLFLAAAATDIANHFPTVAATAASSETDEKRPPPPQPTTINWDELDDLAPEWGADSGLEDLLSLSTSYWEPGLGPRAPRRVPASADLAEDGNDDIIAFVTPEEPIAAAAELRESGGGGETPSAPELNDLMHQAMQTVNSLIYNLEKDKGE
jgi:hypothetical protein